MGDLLTGVPALRGLRAAFPDHHLVLAMPGSLAPLVAPTGAVDEVVDAFPSLEPVADLPRAPQVAVNLHGRGPESHRLLLRSAPGSLVAFANPYVPGTETFPRWSDDEHEVARWCRLLTENGIAADPDRLDIEWPFPKDASLEDATLIHPGAKSPARRWPPARWAAVARHEVKIGRRVILSGGAGEEELAREVALDAGIPERDVRAGDRGIVELATLVASAGRVASGDTGVAHLATALGTPSVVLFGPNSPAQWGPPPSRKKHVVLWAGQVGDPWAERPSTSLLAVEISDVVAALEKL